MKSTLDKYVMYDSDYESYESKVNFIKTPEGERVFLSLGFLMGAVVYNFNETRLSHYANNGYSHLLHEKGVAPLIEILINKEDE